MDAFGLGVHMCPSICERHLFFFTKQEGFPEMQDTITVINLVKLLKSDLLFKLIMARMGWLDVVN